MKIDNKVNIWQETFPVRFGEIDKSDRLKLSSVFQFFQEAAISHAENLGVGRSEMERTGQVWILSRISVMVNRRPQYGEVITVRSWPRGGEKLFAVRDYDIRNSSDIPVVSARSGWLIVDLEKRRPLRPNSVMGNLPLNDGLDAMTSMPVSLEAHGNLQKVTERKALYTDVDYNGHVNNVSYIKWIEDSLEPQLLEKAERIKFDINYLTEILSGETTGIFSAQVDSVHKFEGRKTESGQTAFRAELHLWD
jgi:acyl-ACP thioesterase